MNDKALGLACLASLAAPAAMALDTDLAIAGRDTVIIGDELMNKHWSEGRVRVDDVSNHAYGDLRFYDVGLHVDGVMALAGDDTPAPGLDNDDKISSFETTEVTLKLDYLLEVENIVQILPYLETTVYPNVNGRTPFNWIGTEAWFMLPLEGIELGGSAQYNLTDQTDTANTSGGHHHWLFTVGAREFWQDAPLDLMLWQTVDLASRSYHRDTVGSDQQGITTVNLGAKATLPLPYEEMWAFLKVEGHWYVTSDDKDALDLQGRDNSEVIIGIGIEYRSE
jgi:hypothetical protein